MSAAPQTGAHQCFGGPAGNMKLSFGGGAAYANEQGKQGPLRSAKGGQIAFVSGPWAGFHAKVLGPGGGADVEDQSELLLHDLRPPLTQYRVEPFD